MPILRQGDENMKIFLAGTEGNTEARKVVRENCLYALDTFYYVKTSKPSDHRRFEDYLLDSGAFSFMNSGKEITPSQLEDYVHSYADYIVKNDIPHYFELDIDRIIGYDKVLKIREYLEKTTQRPCIPVWHDWRGKQNFIDMCDRYDFVALGGFAKARGRNKILWQYIKNFIDEAHRRHAKIHGLGFTKHENLPDCPFDTVDSSSWLSGGQYGMIWRFAGNKMEHRQRQPHEKLNISGYNQLELANGLEWVKFQRYAKEHL